MNWENMGDSMVSPHTETFVVLVLLTLNYAMSLPHLELRWDTPILFSDLYAKLENV